MSMETEKFTFFWHGHFSQWFPSAFSVDGVKYACAEQYMMVRKAILFGDEWTAREFMLAFDPRAVKALGRRVEGFSQEVWEYNRVEIVTTANFAKFSQNQELEGLLRATAGTTLVEASPFDKIWGIGLSENDVRAKSRLSWRGENLLGEILTKVRTELFGS